MAADPLAWVAPAARLLRPLSRDGTEDDGASVSGPLDDNELADTAAALFEGPGQIVPTVLAAGRSHRWRVERFQTELTGRAAEDYRLFVAVAYQPAETVRLLAPRVESPAVWTTVTELFEAIYQLAVAGKFAAAGVRGQRTGLPYLARSRWVLLSLPFRPDTRASVQPDDAAAFDDGGDLLAQARLARDDWLSELDHIEDHPRLAGRVDVAAEATELCRFPLTAASLTAAVRSPPSSEQPAAHRATRASSPDGPDDIDRAVWRRCADEHLLARFRVRSVARLTWRMLPPTARGLTAAAGALFAAGFIVLACSWPWGSAWAAGHGDRFSVASGLFLLGYATVAAAVVHEPCASWPWLLRQPAAATVGFVALTAFTPTWWTVAQGSPLSARWLLAGGLVGAELFYLLVEAANHTRDRALPLLGRVAVVLGVGLAHATAVSVAGLRWAAPLIAEDGGKLDQWWAPTGGPPGVVPPGLLVTFTAAWSFVFGVFAQILWDDRPVTGPLAHLRWRGR